MHIRPIFGHPKGAIISKPAPREEEIPNFDPIKNKWGTTDPVYTALPGKQWEGEVFPLFFEVGHVPTDSFDRNHHFYTGT